MNVSLALVLCACAVLVVLAALFVFGLRRRLIQRSGGTFDCSLRWDVPPPAPVETGDGEDDAEAQAEDSKGRGWVYGVARYRGDHVDWFRVFSYAPRPRRTLRRGLIEVLGRRQPSGEEELALLSDQIVLICTVGPTRVELAVSEDALTGFLAWLEAAPPGQNSNVA